MRAWNVTGGVFVAILVLLLTVGCQAKSSGSDEEVDREGPYARLDERRIAALAPKRIADLLAGRGAGYALAAELNHYPGPMHVLELANRLRLTPAQRRRARQASAAVHETAKALGRRLVALETELDRLFRSGAATRRRVDALTSAIADVDARLRSVHLRAHLAMRATLRPEQVAQYDRLRGYAAGDGSPQHRAGHDPRRHAGRR